jgi:ABC-type sulfate transport system substrate-binding protein
LDGVEGELLAKSQFQPMFKSKGEVTRKFSEQFPQVKSLGISKDFSPFSQKKL